MQNPDCKPFPANENEHNLWIESAQKLLPELISAHSSFSPQAVLSLLTTPHVFVLAYAAMAFDDALDQPLHCWIDAFRKLHRSYSLSEVGAACYLGAAAAVLTRMNHPELLFLCRTRVSVSDASLHRSP